MQPQEAFNAASAKTKEKYKSKPKTEEELIENKKQLAYFEAKLTTKIDEKVIDATDPAMKQWVSHVTEITSEGKARYKCFEPFTGDDATSGEPMVIEDRDGDDLPPPPNRQYKTPHALIPELQKSISEMLEKKGLSHQHRNFDPAESAAAAAARTARY
eukprot:SAG11_NODE_1217_length_5498_cov_3.519444_1_plen_158_part_00